jgi:hypothetical protein
MEGKVPLACTFKDLEGVMEEVAGVWVGYAYSERVDFHLFLPSPLYCGNKVFLGVKFLCDRFISPLELHTGPTQLVLRLGGGAPRVCCILY